MKCTFSKWVRPVRRVFMPCGMNHVRWACSSAPRALGHAVPGRAALRAPTAASRNIQKVQQPKCERQVLSWRKLSKEDPRCGSPAWWSVPAEARCPATCIVRAHASFSEMVSQSWFSARCLDEDAAVDAAGVVVVCVGGEHVGGE
eukprot:7863925-Alexandrium_andersonii.AAC.1